jgi:hypothetical protein
MAGRYVIAVDWSGRADAGQAERIWMAEASEGQLVELRNGRSRDAVVVSVGEAAGQHDRLVVGLDFAFSFPAWWVRERRLSTAREVWRMTAGAGEDIIAMQPKPFWGRSGSSAVELNKRYRRTDQALIDRGLHPKSVFQLAGAGAVGVGSIRGMPCVLTLAERYGFSVWPFDEPSPATVVEIYPRLLTGPVDKSRFWDRHDYLHEHFPEQDPVLLERAAGSEDAFDAAVSALRMAQNLPDIEHPWMP